jgi:hypothetical protein
MIEKAVIKYSILKEEGNIVVSLISDRTTQRFSFFINNNKVKVKRTNDWIRIDYNENYFQVDKNNVSYFIWTEQAFQEYIFKKPTQYTNTENHILVEFVSLNSQKIKIEFKRSEIC